MAIKTLLKSILNVNCIKIKNIEFMQSTQSLFIYVDMTNGKKHRCPICNKKCPGYDSTTKSRKWRSLDFGSCKVFIVADVCRICCEEHGVLTESVPWAYHHSNFTKEFEEQIAYLAIHLNKTEVSKIMRIAWNTVGEILSRTRKRLEPDYKVRFKNLRRIGIDETSYRKGHKYVTVVVDHDTNQIVWVHDGHDKETLKLFMEELTQEQREAIELVSGDGARWLKSCVDEYLPNAKFCIDGYHVVSWTIEAMDTLRKELWHQDKANKRNAPKRGRGRPGKDETVIKSNPKFKKSYKYALGKNPENLSKYQADCLYEVKELYPKLFRGYQLKEGLRIIFQLPKGQVKEALDKWLSWARRSQIKPFVELYKKIKRHYDAIIATTEYNLSNARIESMNNKIKVLIRQSYGFRNIENMIDMIMIVCSNLSSKIQLPYQTRIKEA